MHQGIMYYTIGQRKGLSIGGPGDAWFVVGKDYDDNVLYVCQGDQNEWLMSEGALISDVNWNLSKKPEGEYECTAKFRYRQKDNDVTIHFIDETTLYVSFKQPVKTCNLDKEQSFIMVIFALAEERLKRFIKMIRRLHIYNVRIYWNY